MHLNHLKRSKKRKGQVDYFTLLEKNDEFKIKLIDLRKKEDQRMFTDKRQDAIQYRNGLKRD